MSKELENMIYGIRAIMETMESGKDLEKIFVQKGLKGDLVKQMLSLAHQRSVPVSTVPVEKINRFTRKNHQGVVAMVSPVQYHNLEHVLPGIFEKGETPLLLVLDRITDVRNFGAIARSAECLGVHAIVIPTKNAAQINADAVKTSAGALNFIPVCRERNLMDSLRFLRDSGLQIVASTEKGNEMLHEADFTLPAVIVMGNEEDGIDDAILELCDQQVKIPMKGKIASLNVSTAAGMMLYEAICQREEFK